MPFLSGVAVTLVAQIATHLFQRRRTVEDKLLENYADFAGVSVTELGIAKELEAMAALMPAQGSEGRPSWNEEAKRLERERHGLRRELAAMAFKISFLEHDRHLIDKVKQIATNQPFLAMGPWNEGNFTERFDKYNAELREHAILVNSLAEEIRRVHSPASWSWPIFRTGAR